MLTELENKRLKVSRNTDSEKKSLLGQFFTPERTATFMAGLFPVSDGFCRLLDPGAGIGSLSAAFLERWKKGGFQFQNVKLDVFEIDKMLLPHLAQTLDTFSNSGNFQYCIKDEDFIHTASESLSGNLFSQPIEFYTHIILNPPYKKINSESAHRLALRRVGIETVNLYSSFVALAVEMAVNGGQIVAIIPRSFCNGPYYKPFRKFILERASLCHIHLFKSRNDAFKDDGVLQENIIIRLERGGLQGLVKVSTSKDDTFSDLTSKEHPFDCIVFPNDPEQFIHIPIYPEKGCASHSSQFSYSLEDLGINVSTGPVVDFRLKEYLRDMPESSTVPLLYPCHFNNGFTIWPITGAKKPNAIVHNDETQKWLYPSGFYCVVRRFSTKEEKRRIVASVVDPSAFGDVSMLGFENHLNLFHENKRGLIEPLARGLSVYLNSTAIDESFRSFNGHTQVNVSDLKKLKYPSRVKLIELGEWAKQQSEVTQTMIDSQL